MAWLICICGLHMPISLPPLAMAPVVAALWLRRLGGAFHFLRGDGQRRGTMSFENSSPLGIVFESLVDTNTLICLHTMLPTNSCLCACLEHPSWIPSSPHHASSKLLPFGHSLCTQLGHIVSPLRHDFYKSRLRTRFVHHLWIQHFLSCHASHTLPPFGIFS